MQLQIIVSRFSSLLKLEQPLRLKTPSISVMIHHVFASLPCPPEDHWASAGPHTNGTLWTSAHMDE